MMIITDKQITKAFKGTNFGYKINRDMKLRQAAKMIGNGWTVDVIVHILKSIK